MTVNKDQHSNYQSNQDSNKDQQHSGHQTEHTRQSDQYSNQSNKGFASIDPQKQREIASQGGKAAHEKGTAHEWDNEEASEAGKRGGAHSYSEQNGR